MVTLGFWKKKKEDSTPKKSGLLIEKLEPGSEIVEEYLVNPFAKVSIVKTKSEGYNYFVQEAALNAEEQEACEKLKSILSKELEAPEELESDVLSYILSESKKVAQKYKKSLGEFNETSWRNIFYHVVRDLAGYEEVNTLMIDPNIEDISCNGLRRPIYVWHRKYESIPTNIMFIDELVYDNFVVKLAHRSGKHISSAHPMLDAMLPEKHRLSATFMREISSGGSSFTIRKFRHDPFSIVDLIKLGTLNERIAAYLWILLESKMSLMVVGGTGAGKTSLLNALITLIEPNDKIVTVEGIAELNLSHENWVQLVSRTGFQFGASDASSISLFDLVKLSLRYRPDYLVVGEVRGEEAYVLFQAVATGHGGLCTMHADSLDNAVNRLTSPPMNVSKVYIPLMNVCIYAARVDLPKKSGGLPFGRRIRNMWEVQGFEDYNRLVNWDPSNDSFRTDLQNSSLISTIAEKRGLSSQSLLTEISNREKFLGQLVKRDVKDHTKVAGAIMNYYQRRTMTVGAMSAKK